MVSKERRIEQEMERRKAKDFAEIVNLVLSSPIRRDVPVEMADGNISMDELSRMNTDVQTRIISQMAYNAGMGDVKAAEFLMKYGGLEPPAKQEILIDVPQLVDDMTDRVTPVPPSRRAGLEEDEE